eukprot:702255-Pelagomonas_calceolata.AAC.1
MDVASSGYQCSRQLGSPRLFLVLHNRFSLVVEYMRISRKVATMLQILHEANSGAKLEQKSGALQQLISSTQVSNSAASAA